MILKSVAGGRVVVPLARQVELVREFERSGLSGPRFVAMAGVKYQTFAGGDAGRRHGHLPAQRKCSTSSQSGGLWMYPSNQLPCERDGMRNVECESIPCL